LAGIEGLAGYPRKLLNSSPVRTGESRALWGVPPKVRNSPSPDGVPKLGNRGETRVWRGVKIFKKKCIFFHFF
jgi:hypothetical protein